MDKAEPKETRESNRARVRRLLLDPLGFRSPKGVSVEVERDQLATIADEVGYLTDDELMILARIMAPHGAGGSKCFWPDRASFIGFAHVVRARPLAEDPKVLSWWASIEGQRMVLDGTLVETYQYFERHRTPPAKPGARAQVAEAARDNARRLTVIEEKQRLGYAIPAEDLAWRQWYRGRLDYLTALVEQARAARAQGATQGDAA